MQSREVWLSISATLASCWRGRAAGCVRESDRGGRGGVEHHQPADVSDHSVLYGLCSTSPSPSEIRCPLLDDPANGQVTTPPPYFVNATVLYICDAGYELRDGSIRRVCMADGTWSGSAPTCVCE